MIQQLTRAGWSVVLRRLSEFISMGVIPLAVLVLPIVLVTLAGNDILFKWPTLKMWQVIVSYRLRLLT